VDVPLMRCSVPEPLVAMANRADNQPIE
jgi:hypothetical protein